MTQKKDVRTVELNILGLLSFFLGLLLTSNVVLVKSPNLNISSPHCEMERVKQMFRYHHECQTKSNMSSTTKLGN